MLLRPEFPNAEAVSDALSDLEAALAFDEYGVVYKKWICAQVPAARGGKFSLVANREVRQVRRVS